MSFLAWLVWTLAVTFLSSLSPLALVLVTMYFPRLSTFVVELSTLDPLLNNFRLVKSDGQIVGPFKATLGQNGVSGTLPSECIALFSITLIRELCVDLNWHRDYRGDDVPWMQVRRGDDPEVFVSEAKVRRYLERESKEQDDAKSGQYRHSLEPWQMVDVNPDLTPETQRHIWELLEENRLVFLCDQLPAPMAGEEHIFQVKPDFKFPACPEPRWTPAKADYIDAWAEDGLNSGLLEPAPFSRVISYVHIADKPGPDELSWSLRPCGDFVRVNLGLIKIVPSVPYLPGMVTHFFGCKYFMSTDAPKAYHLILLHESTRDLTTVWTRKFGKVRFTRMPFGIKNAGTILQERFLKALSGMPAASREATKNYADDFLQGSRTEEELVLFLEHFLVHVVVPNNISLKASKNRIGYSTADVGSYTVGHNQRTLAAKHLEPIATMQPPDDVPSLRRTLGLFVSSLLFIEDYKITARPLTRLTGKVPWIWGDEQQRAFDTIREAILSRPALYNPDYTRQLFIDVDSSDLGGGGCLYQVPEGKDTMKSENKQASCMFLNLGEVP